ncbi:MAG: PTS sugar transporter subunit IIA [Spirochaetales bacterium]|nr:PTS sugar transporter subunit IIA [Spirochaetales bacterium]
MIYSLSRECIQFGNTAGTKTELLSEISLLAKKSGRLQKISREEIFDALQKREELSSTGLGHGLAIPHCSFPALTEFVVGLVIIKDGIDFEAIDASKSKLVFFLIGPQEQRRRHVEILSAISKIAINNELISALIAAETADRVLNLLSDI